MLILAINTAEAACDVAVTDAGEVRAHLTRTMARGQDAALPGCVDDVLAQAGAGFAELNRIAVVVGPGSFTGVRIGVSYARGLALALDIPCIGITSLEACVAPDHEKAVRVALQAKRRPPDITFWTQLVAPHGVSSPPEEWPLERLRADSADRAHNAPADIGLAGEAAAPSAAYAGQRATALSPSSHPPTPAYVRAPDALLPGGRAP